MKVNVILASTPSGIIGVDGTLPWKLRSDLIHFKSLTDGHPIIMGRKTYESLPGILPNRLHIVVTANPHKVKVSGNVIVTPTLDDALTLADIHSGSTGECFIIGGATLYQPVLNLIDTIEQSDKKAGIIKSIYWTRVDAKDDDFSGDITRLDVSMLENELDTYLKSSYSDNKLEVQTVDINKDQQNQYDFKIVKLTNWRISNELPK